MTEKKEKAASAEKKPAAEKPAAAAPAKKTESAPAKKPAPAKAAPKADAPKKPAHSGKTVKVVQIGSPIGRQKYQRATLIGLGLNKINRTRELQDTPEVRGMIESVKHLVKVVG